MAVSSSNTLGTDKFNELVIEGRKLTGYLFLDKNELDRAEGGNAVGRSCQVQQGDWWRIHYNVWEDSIQTGRAPTTIQTVSKALGSLNVGSNSPYQDTFAQPRNVNTEVVPHGRNIPVTMTYRAGHRQYETIFNILDGVIAITHIESNEPLEGSPIDNISEFTDMSAVLGAVFWKFHKTKPPMSPILKAELQIAKAMVQNSVESRLPLQQLPNKTFNAWLPVAASPDSGINQTTIEKRMSTWLNYVIVHVSHEHETYAVIRECLRQTDHDNVAAVTWELCQIYPIGYWIYYALLGSNLGRSVAWFLARHKNPEHILGRKAIKSIRLFHAEYPEDMTAEEAQKYYTPVLLFEIVDMNDEVRLQQKAVEMTWTASPNSACHTWYTERVGSDQA